MVEYVNVVEVVATVKELKSFAIETGHVLENHREQLARHESILLAQFKGGESHHAAITELRELVAAQSQLLASMERALKRIAKAIGMDPSNPRDIEHDDDRPEYSNTINPARASLRRLLHSCAIASPTRGHHPDVLRHEAMGCRTSRMDSKRC